MGKTAGVITINLSAGTRDFVRDMETANLTVTKFGSNTKQLGSQFKDMGTHGVSGVQAVSGALRVMEGGITNNIRAAERWLATTLKLGPAAQAAFGITGAIAFAGILTKIGEEAASVFKEIRDAPALVSVAFGQLNSGLRTTTDGIIVSTDRVLNSVAKLEGKRENTLKLALDEAVQAADDLSDALEKDVTSFNKLLDEKKLGGIKAFFTNQDSTSDIAEYFGGVSGVGGESAVIREINKVGAAKIAAARDAKNLNAAAEAASARDIALTKQYGIELAHVSDELAKAQELAKPHDRIDPNVGPVREPGADERQRVEVLTAARDRIEEQMRYVQARAGDAAAKQSEDLGRAAADAAKLERPLKNKLDELQADITGAQARLNAVGADEAHQVVAKAQADAAKAIQVINRGREEQVPGNTIKAADAEKVQSLTLTRDQTNAEAAWREQFAEGTTRITDRIKSLKELTAAIGLGYEATKRASVETSLMGELKSHYSDPKWMSDHQDQVSSLRSGFSQEFDEQHKQQATQATDKLRDQIALEKALAIAQAQGAEAVRNATFAARIQTIEKEGAKTATGELTVAVKAQIAAEMEWFNAQQQNRSAGDLAAIDARIAAVRNLTAAEVDGAEAVRRATNENKYAEIRKQGGARLPGLSGMTVAEGKEREFDQAAHQGQVTTEAVKPGNAYRDQLDTINQERAALKQIQVTSANGKQISIDLADLENKRLKVLLDEFTAIKNLHDETLKLQEAMDLQLGSAADGVRAFFLEIQTQAQTAAQNVKTTLDSALDQVSGNLTKSLTGQKTSWGKMSQGLGEGMLKNSIKSALQVSLGAFGKHLGLDGKPDGSASSPFHVITQNGGHGGPTLKLPGLFGTPKQPSGNPGGGTVFGGGSQSNPAVFSITDMLKNSPRSGGFNPKVGGINEDASEPSAPSKAQDNLGPVVADIASTVIKGNDRKGGIGGILSTLGAALQKKLFSNIFDSLIPRAVGGDVSPSSAYLVGEHGPEILTGASGRILDHSTSMRALGGAGNFHQIIIDARGAPPGAEQKIAAMVDYAHKSAIANSVRVNADRARRMPSAAMGHA